MKLANENTDIVGLHPIFGPAINALDELWLDHLGMELCITAGLNGKHSRYSRHYQGCAIDIRTWKDTENASSGQMGTRQRREVATLVRRAIGKNFKVIDEGTHLHIAFKPEYKAWTS